MVLGSNTQTLRDSIITEIREQMQPVFEAAAAADTLNARMDTAEAQAAAAEIQAQRTSTQRYDARAYGDMSVNPSAAVQAAIDAAAATGGTAYVPDGTWVMPTNVQLKHGTVLELAPNAHLDFSAMAAPVGVNAAVYGGGSTTALPALSGYTPTKGTDTLKFATAHGLVAGDVVLLYNPTDFSFSMARNYYRDGEFARVAWVLSTTEVLLTADLQTTHNVTVTQPYKVTPIATGVRGGRMTFKFGNPGIKISYGVDVSISDLNLTGSVLSQLWIDRCYNVSIDGLHAREFNDPLGTASNYTHYGLLVGNSQNVLITGSHLESGRHGFTTGGDSLVGCVPNRNIAIADSYVTGWGAGETGDVAVPGLALHGNIEYFNATNCIAPRGIHIGGNHTTVQGCDIGTSLSGVLVRGTELTGADHTIINNRCKVTTNTAAQGWVELYWAWGGVADLQEAVTIRNNTFDFGSYVSTAGSTWGVYINNSANNLPINANVIVDGNSFRSRLASTPNPYFGVMIRGQFRTISAARNSGNAGIRIFDTTAQRVDLSGNDFQAPLGDGIMLSYASAPFTRSLVTINGTTVNLAARCGLDLGATSGVQLYMGDVTAKECNTAGLETGARSSSMYIHDFQEVIRKQAIVGAVTATQTYADAVSTVTRFTDIHPAIVFGSSTTATLRTSVLMSRVVALPAYA